MEINVGDLSKPATVLVEKIAEGVGGLFVPHQIKRVADANAYARLLAAKTDVTVSSIQHRTLDRLSSEEVRKQGNMEAVVLMAIPELSSTATPEYIEQDWLTYLFESVRLFSDKEMQLLWAKILAGEANEPGSFSKRTISVLSMMGKEDAHQFSQLCEFVWHIDAGFVPLIYDTDDLIYKNSNIDFTVLMHLSNIGLIRFDPILMLTLQELDNPVRADYNDKRFAITLPEGVNDLEVGRIILTSVGEELVRVCSPATNEDFVAYLEDRWKANGIVLEAI